MIRSSWWVLAIGFLVVLWQESGENVFLFCYRICCSAFSFVRAGELSTIPCSPNNEAACWNQSVTCSTLSTTSKE
jgi:hypothetical protein